MLKSFLLLFMVMMLSFSAKSQMVYQTSLNLDQNNKQVYITIYQYKDQFLFDYDFFNIDQCQNKTKLVLTMRNNTLVELKSNKKLGCEKKRVSFSIDSDKIELDQIKLISYTNLITSEQYDYYLYSK